jgi:hypothetical protein
LNNTETRDFPRRRDGWFEANAEIPRIRAGERQEIETLINEEAMLFAKYLKNEKKTDFQELGLHHKAIRGILISLKRFRLLLLFYNNKG